MCMVMQEYESLAVMSGSGDTVDSRVRSGRIKILSRVSVTKDTDLDR
jgi:hypothetical protein